MGSPKGGTVTIGCEFDAMEQKEVPTMRFFGPFDQYARTPRCWECRIVVTTLVAGQLVKDEETLRFRSPVPVSTLRQTIKDMIRNSGHEKAFSILVTATAVVPVTRKKRFLQTDTRPRFHPAAS